MNFKAKVFIPNPKLYFFQKWALTEQLTILSLLVLIFMLIIDKVFKFENQLNGYVLVKIVYGLCVIPIILNITYRFFEFERINGKIDGEISFEEKGIKVNQTLYLFSEIKSLDISYGNVYRDFTGNRKVGAYLSQGLNN